MGLCLPFLPHMLAGNLLEGEVPSLPCGDCAAQIIPEVAEVPAFTRFTFQSNESVPECSRDLCGLCDSLNSPSQLTPQVSLSHLGLQSLHPSPSRASKPLTGHLSPFGQ